LRFFICFALVLFFRFQVALSLIPALTVWWLWETPLPRRRLLIGITTGTALLFVLIFALSGLLQTLPSRIALRQSDFLQEEGHSRIPLPAMDGTWTGLLKVHLTAARNGLFEPLPGTGGRGIYLAFSLELLLLWSIVLTALFAQTRRPSTHPLTPG